MYCTFCGAKIYDGDKFCQKCGIQVNEQSVMPEKQPVTENTEPVLQEAENITADSSINNPISQFPENSDGYPDPTISTDVPVPQNATEFDPLTKAEAAKVEEFDHSADTLTNSEPRYDNVNNATAQSYNSYTNTTAKPMYNPANAKKEKVFFGKGAFILCLVVIGILSVTTGVFAGLYFSL